MATIKKLEEEKRALVSFRAKQSTACPVCKTNFYRENLHSGGGRLISGSINSELRRLYKTNPKYGEIFPQIYTLSVCPYCLYASFPHDFNELDNEESSSLSKTKELRSRGIEKILGKIDFQQDRNLILGAASYLLALDCYRYRALPSAPTPKRAVCSLRAAWLFSDITTRFPKLGYERVRDILYFKAVRYYQPTLEIMASGAEPHAQFMNILGPDVDKNWGFDGVVYINSYLLYKNIKKLCSDDAKQVELLHKARQNLARLYGHGKVSFNKPSLLVNCARELRDEISSALAELNADSEKSLKSDDEAVV